LVEKYFNLPNFIDQKTWLESTFGLKNGTPNPKKKNSRKERKVEEGSHQNYPGF
jgi:hypothetical protein